MFLKLFETTRTKKHSLAMTSSRSLRLKFSQRNAKRRTLFDTQDDIDSRREQLIAAIEGKLQQRIEQTELFSVRWKLV